MQVVLPQFRIDLTGMGRDIKSHTTMSAERLTTCHEKKDYEPPFSEATTLAAIVALPSPTAMSPLHEKEIDEKETCYETMGAILNVPGTSGSAGTTSDSFLIDFFFFADPLFLGISSVVKWQNVVSPQRKMDGLRLLALAFSLDSLF